MPTASEPLGVYAQAICDYTETLLEPYIARLRSGPGRIRSKEINDPIWGTIVLQPHEVIVLDSPLVQRLRAIRQLGVAHLVYSSAMHSRFEHSVGVCHQVGRLAESINEHSDGPPLLNPDYVRLLRLTGLCHDIGHGLMSHVSENALRDDQACIQLVLAFRRSLKKDGRVQLSEMAAHYMLASPAFEVLLKSAFEHGGDLMPTNMPQMMSRIVIGESVGDDYPLLHELISGPFDADKLDYMPRDAAMCGVPVVTDINRLIQKIRAVALTKDELPDELQPVVSAGAGTHLIVGIASSGASTLDEVAIGRSLMFDKIYRHHKVRSAEAMVSSALNQVTDAITKSRALIPLMINDHEFLALGQHLGPLDAGDSADDSIMTPAGLDLVARLRNRELFVRGFAFSQHLPEDPYRGDAENRQAIEAMIRLCSSAATRREFVDEVITQVRTMLDLLGLTEALDRLPGGDLTPYVWVDPPAASIPDTKPDPNRAYLIDTDGKPRRVDQVNAETRGWSDAYVNTHDIGYVFTVRELAPYVFIASEVAAKKLYNLRAPKEALTYAKQQEDFITDLKRQLEAAGYFDGLPPELRPPPAILERGDALRRLRTISDSLRGYQGPADGVESGVVAEPALNVDRLRDWIRQFGPVHAEVAFAALEQIMLVGRAQTNAALEMFLSSDQGTGFRGGSVCPVGQPKDGSSIVAYHGGDVAQNHGCEIRSLEDALLHGGPLILVDDFIGRGSSSLSILQAMMGAEDTEDLHEERPGPLADKVAEEFKTRDIAFVFTAGFADGADHLREGLADLGFPQARVYVHIGEQSLPSLIDTELLEVDPTARQEFIDRVTEIGRQLLVGQDPAKIGERAFGYGNRALLMLFPYNTPTATLTALWKGGEVDGWPWRPLFPRRQKR